MNLSEVFHLRTLPAPLSALYALVFSPGNARRGAGKDRSQRVRIPGFTRFT